MPDAIQWSYERGKGRQGLSFPSRTRDREGRGGGLLVRGRRYRLSCLNDNDSDNDRPALSAMIEAAVAAAATFEGVLSLRESRRRLSSSVVVCRRSFGVLSPPSQ